MQKAKSSFKPADFSLGTTYNERTKAFVGVDLTDPQVEVALSRGVYGRNYVYKQNGKVETRFAYEEVAERNKSFGPGFEALLGLWTFKANNTEYNIAAIAKNKISPTAKHKFVLRTWEIDNDRIKYGSTDIASLNTDSLVAKVYATTTEKQMWFATGSGLFVLYYDNGLKAKRASEWEGTHIPTVTYMGVPANTTTPPSTTFITLEYPNLLSKYRRDMYLLGEELDDSDGFPRINIKTDYFSFKEAEFDDSHIVAPIALTGDCTASNPSTKLTAALAFMLEGRTLLVYADEMPSNSVIQPYAIVDDGDGNLFIDGTDAQVYGVAFYDNSDNYGKVILFDNPEPMLAGKPNLALVYQYVSDLDFADQTKVLDGCNIGAMFGKNNSLNRLWLSGNPNMPNYVFHSAQPYTALNLTPTETDGDLSYFPDESYIKFGGTNNAVTALEVVTNDTMMVLKNKSGTERTMYYVTPLDVTRTVISAEDNVLQTGDITIAEEEYSTSLSNTSSAALQCFKPSCNFNGDVLFLSNEKQLVGLDTVGITGDSQRVATTRSHYIDRALLEELDGNSAIYTAGNYLFLFGKNSLYVSHVSSYTQDSRQYEWWPCDLPDEYPVRCVTEVGGEIYITTTKSVYRLNNITAVNKPVADLDKTFFGTGDMTSGDGDPYLTCNATFGALLPKVPLVNGSIPETFAFDYDKLARFYWETSDNASLYYLLGDIGGKNQSTRIHRWLNQTPSPTKELYYTEDPYTMSLLRDGMTLHVVDSNQNTEDDLAVSLLELEDVDEAALENYGYAGMYFAIGDPTDIEAWNGAYVEAPHSLYAFVDEAGTKVYLGVKYGDSEIRLLALSNLEGADVALTGYVETSRQITPVFMTLRLVQGKLGYDKIIDNITIWNDSANPCELYVGVISNKDGRSVEVNGIFDPGVGFDLNQVDFENTRFDRNAVVEFYNLKRFARVRQSFTLCFTAKSKRNSVLSGLDILYRVKKARYKR